MVQPLAGLGVGYGVARRWKTEALLPARETSPPDTSQLTPASAELARTAKPTPAHEGKAVDRCALLVGMPKYDHLPQAQHLTGPANDVRLMRRLLQDRYQFPTDGIVSMTENEGTPDRRPARANIERQFRWLADDAHEGDQIVILLASHGDRQPERCYPHTSRYSS